MESLSDQQKSHFRCQLPGMLFIHKIITYYPTWRHMILATENNCNVVIFYTGITCEWRILVKIELICLVDQSKLVCILQNFVLWIALTIVEIVNQRGSPAIHINTVHRLSGVYMYIETSSALVPQMYRYARRIGSSSCEGALSCTTLRFSF